MTQPLTRAVALTDQGLVRTRNEDAFLTLPERDIFVVADGMGGHARGDVASRLCVDTIRACLDGTLDPAFLESMAERHRGGEHPPTSAELELMTAVEVANLAVFEAQQRQEELQGMGTTLVALRFVAGVAFGVYCGDSRIYRFRDGQLQQMSEDHSLLNEYLKNHLIRPEDAATFPRKNVILRALGLRPLVEMDVMRQTTLKGDVYLLCSDGLHDMLDDVQIAGLLAEGTLSERCEALVDASLEAGGRDNVTAVLLEYVGPGAGLS